MASLTDTRLDYFKNIIKEQEKLIIEQKEIIKNLEKGIKNFNKLKLPECILRKPSGFAMSTYISPNMCDFIGVEHGSMKPRTEITRFICRYIKDKNLQNPKNKRVILPDSKLLKILNLVNIKTLTYFNLQRAIKGNFSSTPYE